MPYKDPEARREYARKWMAARRAEWFDGKVCVDCGTTERLELDHVDPATKIHHCVWSWAKARREAELAKCVARCHDCHLAKSIAEGDLGAGTRRVPIETVEEIRRLYAEGRSPGSLADQFGVARWTVRSYVANTIRVNA